MSAKKNVAKIVRKNQPKVAANKTTTVKVDTPKNVEVVGSTTENGNITLKVNSLLSEIDNIIPNKNKPVEVELEVEPKTENVKANSDNVSWLEDEVSKLAGENQKLYAMIEDLQSGNPQHGGVYQNGGVVDSTVPPDAQSLAAAILFLFNEIQVNLINMGVSTDQNGNHKFNLILNPVGFLNRMIDVMPFLEGHKKYHQFENM